MLISLSSLPTFVVKGLLLPPSSLSGDRVESLSCSLVMIPDTILTFPLFLLFFLFFLFSHAAMSPGLLPVEDKQHTDGLGLGNTVHNPILSFIATY